MERKKWDKPLLFFVVIDAVVDWIRVLAASDDDAVRAELFFF